VYQPGDVENDLDGCHLLRLRIPRHILRQFERPLEDASEPVTRSSKSSRPLRRGLQISQGCGPHGAAWSSFTSCVISRGRNFEAKPSTKSLFEYTAAQCARRSASSLNFQRCRSWLIVPVSLWK